MKWCVGYWFLAFSPTYSLAKDSVAGLVSPVSVCCDWMKFVNLICNFYFSVALVSSIF